MSKFASEWDQLIASDNELVDSALFNSQELLLLPMPSEAEEDCTPQALEQTNPVEQPAHEENIPSSLVASAQACDFRLVFPQESSLHSVPKTRRPHYSDKMKTLFVKNNQACPFTFVCTDTYTSSEDVYLRALTVYLRREDAKEVVRRCLDHTSRDQGGAHIMSCRHEQVVYDTSGGCLSVLVPYPQGQTGEAGQTFTFEFVCLSSCLTPLKNKPLQVLFTLERGGVVIGRDSVVVKISSSPYRDMTKAEAKIDGEDKTEGEPSSRKRKLKSSATSLPGDESYQKMVEQDVSFAQYARKRHPDWWTEYHKDMGTSTAENSVD